MYTEKSTHPSFLRQAPWKPRIGQFDLETSIASLATFVVAHHLTSLVSMTYNLTNTCTWLKNLQTRLKNGDLDICNLFELVHVILMYNPCDWSSSPFFRAIGGFPFYSRLSVMTVGGWKQETLRRVEGKLSVRNHGNENHADHLILQKHFD